MESASQNTHVTGQRFDKTVQVSNVESQPDHGLFQPWYPLSEADFLRLWQSNSLLATLGGATMTFGISYIAPKLVNYCTGVSGAALRDQEILLAAIAVLVGAALMVGSIVFSRGRRKIRSKIKKHFANYPPEEAYRVRKS